MIFDENVCNMKWLDYVHVISLWKQELKFNSRDSRVLELQLANTSRKSLNSEAVLLD